MYMFNMPIEGMVSLEMSILYILAIIMTPIALGVLSYSKIHDTKTVFYVFTAVVLILFAFFMPADVTLIYVLITITSVLVSHFAGPEFVWFNVLNTS